MSVPKHVAGPRHYLGLGSMTIALVMLLVSTSWTRAQGQAPAPAAGPDGGARGAAAPQAGGAAGQAGAAGAAGQRGQPTADGRIQGPGANAFPGQTPVNALLVTGGCCHDYVAQSAR
jgi:hypothetical protein